MKMIKHILIIYREKETTDYIWIT